VIYDWAFRDFAPSRFRGIPYLKNFHRESEKPRNRQHEILAPVDPTSAGYATLILRHYSRGGLYDTLRGIAVPTAVEKSQKIAVWLRRPLG
jgi:hypothetical protein